VLFGSSLSDASINWVVTKPGPGGSAIAFGAEAAMTMLMMSVVLVLSNHPRWASRTGIASAVLLAAFITIEAPLSGMSLNPARTFGPALFARDFTGVWIYFLAPPAGMALAAAAFSRLCPRGRCPRGMHGAHL
jgi:aquaporin Z